MLKGRRLIYLMISFLLLDVAFPLTFFNLPFLPFVFILEFLLFVVYNTFVLVKKGLNASLKKILIVVCVANLTSSFAGLFIPLISRYIKFFIVAFLTSSLIEFIVYLIFFKFPKLDLLKVSFLTNAASYLLLVLYLFL